MKIYILTECNKEGNNYTPQVFKTREEAQERMRISYNDYINSYIHSYAESIGYSLDEKDCDIKCEINENDCYVIRDNDTLNQLNIFECEVEV